MRWLSIFKCEEVKAGKPRKTKTGPESGFRHSDAFTWSGGDDERCDGDAAAMVDDEGSMLSRLGV